MILYCKAHNYQHILDQLHLHAIKSIWSKNGHIIAELLYDLKTIKKVLKSCLTFVCCQLNLLIAQVSHSVHFSSSVIFEMHL